MLKKPNGIKIIYLLLLSLFLQLLALPLQGEEKRVIPGVSFYGFALGGKNRQEVCSLLQEVDKNLKKQAIILHLSEINEQIESDYGAMGISVDTNRVWQEAISLGRSGRWWENLWQRWQVGQKGAKIPLYLYVDREAALNSLHELTHSWHRTPSDAGLIIHPDDAIEITPHEFGREIDPAEALTELEYAAAANPGEKLQVVLKFAVVKPTKLKSDIEAYNIKGVVSRFVTRFNAARAGRTNNIKLAAKALDYCMMAPGEVCSFNQVVGPRTKEAGYDEADIIMRNELVPDIGGGVCQVSTTLYNAVLRAELEIVERAPHSMVITYVDPGLDATVVYGYRDFKFRNNTSTHLLIKTSVYGGSLTIKLFGMPYRERKVVIRSIKEREIPPQTVYREDPLVPKGRYILEREGNPGYVYRVERIVYGKKGELLKQELISRDTYPPVDRIIKTFSRSPLLL